MPKGSQRVLRLRHSANFQFAREYVLQRRRGFLFVLISLISLFVFAALTEAVLDGHTEQLDRYVLSVLRNPLDMNVPVGPAWLSRVLIDISTLGDITVLSMVTVAALGFLLLAKRYRYFLVLLLCIPSGALLMAVLKDLIQRQRPDVVPHLVSVTHASFPSGHSMISAIVYLTIGMLLLKVIERKRLKIYTFSCFALLTILIGLSRIYLGVHYPTDVLAGWLAGVAWAVFSYGIVTIVLRRFRRTLE